MGLYINLADGTDKELWLERNATIEAFGFPSTYDENAGHLLVFLVDNGPFTAAGVAFNNGELRAMNSPTDGRRKRWFWVSLEKLQAVGADPIPWQEKYGRG